ncbi:MAG: hypothetical protein ABSE44_07325 [Candidatus Sulfotelmatobacter sp.]
MPQTLDALLTRLEAAKSHYGSGAAAETRVLLDQFSRHTFADARSLIRFHESLLFLRAFPQSPSVVAAIEQLLNTFHQRTEKLRELGLDMSPFDDFDTSGIAGTTMQDTLNFEVARWLARRIPRNVQIAWDDFFDDPQAERAVASIWPRLIPLLAEDADVEANIPWRRWLEAARGRAPDLEWIIGRFEQLRLGEPQQDAPRRPDFQPETRAALYDSLRLPLRWNLKNLKLSRTRNWTRPRPFYYHTEPLIVRSQVSLSDELARPAPRFAKLPRREGESVLHTIREVMAVRYRELYGTTLGDPRSVVQADLGSGKTSRGVVMYFWNLPADRRLPLRAYVAGLTLKNGVPINYIEAIGLCEWLEVGFNTFYTYRHGETAWIYAQALRCLRAFTGATTFSVYPYQIGQNNDEALDSGAFWFYRKLGFRSGRKDLEQLARREEQKIEERTKAANPPYRTPRKTLKRLAEAHMFYDLPRPPGSVPDAISTVTMRTAAGGPVEERPFKGRVDRTSNERGFSPRHDQPGDWDTFSTRTLALRVNRRMASNFAGDAEKIRAASIAQVTRALTMNASRWNSAELNSLANWSLVLPLIPNLSRWSRQEKQALIQIIRAQAGPNEMHYLRLTQQHPCLREELLRLGSKR